jgi:hypothetical protein
VITEKIVSAFAPIVDLIQGLSYPIGLIVMMCGGIVWMIGNKEKGLGLITNMQEWDISLFKWSH